MESSGAHGRSSERFPDIAPRPRHQRSRTHGVHPANPRPGRGELLQEVRRRRSRTAPIGAIGADRAWLTRSSGARTGASSKSTTGCPTRRRWVRASGRRNDSRSTSCADPTVLLPPDADRADDALTFERSSTVRHARRPFGPAHDRFIAHDDAAVQVTSRRNLWPTAGAAGPTPRTDHGGRRRRRVLDGGAATFACCEMTSTPGLSGSTTPLTYSERCANA